MYRQFGPPYRIIYTVHSVQCIVYTVYCIVYRVLCIVYKSDKELKKKVPYNLIILKTTYMIHANITE